MTDTPLPPHEEDDLLAAEYVLGVLDLPERGMADARMRRDPAFVARVAEWEMRLGDLNDEYEPAPAPDLLPAIEARLFPKPARSRRGWLQGLFGVATAAALALAAFIYIVPAAPTFTATLVAEADPLRYEARISGEQLTITRAAGAPADTGRVHELWLIAGNKAPVSLGLIEGTELTVTLPPRAIEAGIVLAVTLEPTGGGPGGKPSGPVVAAGSLVSS